MKPQITVERKAFDALLGKLIATPASAKDGIKPKPKANTGKTPSRPRRLGSK